MARNNLCEMKFSEGLFTIDKPYANELRQKRDTFRRITGTRKNIQDERMVEAHTESARAAFRELETFSARSASDLASSTEEKLRRTRLPSGPWQMSV